MKFNLGKKVVISLALLSGSLQVMAADEKIVCPAINLVKQSWMLLDTVTKATPPKFVVSSTMSLMQDQEHRSWAIVAYADAANMDGALDIGKNIIKNITEAKQKYAISMDDIFLCAYKSPNSTLGVGLIAYKNEQSNLKITSINLNLLK